jgi:hypothetical protein
MKTPITIQLTKNSDSCYFRNSNSPISAMCMGFAAVLNKEAKSATKLQFQISRSPFVGAKQIFSNFYVVSFKKDDGVSFGLPFEGSEVSHKLFNMRLSNVKERFYVKLSVLS